MTQYLWNCSFKELLAEEKRQEAACEANADERRTIAALEDYFEKTAAECRQIAAAVS